MTASLSHLSTTLGHGADAADALTAFTEWADKVRGLSLYESQEDALTALALGANVILATPTGSGKSLVAAGAHFFSFHEKTQTVYTAPIKALVSEKFFDLVDLFGAHNVGMITGDSSINPGAPILCCTAEILANIALRDRDTSAIGQVVMDEFHFYGDPDRGWAWQVPLLLMSNVQFLLMSATLGDVSEISADLSTRTGRETELISSVARPVPLEITYSTDSVHETVERLLDEAKAPIYIVHFNQASSAERAQALSSLKLISRQARDEIGQAIKGFKFSKGFGQTLAKFVKAGIGVHHAGMLPRYRRLVEQLAQKGLLRVICGTDTLGVGINVPIRTVLLTALTKFDGTKMRRLSAREFHQIAGRAGRAGFDTEGDVVVEAPEHEIENQKAAAKAQAKPNKKKVAKKQPPAGFVTWSQKTMENLAARSPEPLRSQMRISHAMLIHVLGRGETRQNEALRVMRRLIFGNHEDKTKQFALARRAIEMFRTLRRSGVVELTEKNGEQLLQLTVDLDDNFALNQPLSPFALATFELLDPDSDSYDLDLISIIEATLEDPRAILRAQEHRARGEAIAQMKADGLEYDERMELLEEVTYPKPLDELIQAAFESYVRDVPWARDFAPSPKTVVRDMLERALSFRDFVNLYDLGRSEGVVLRYLTDAYRALTQSVPRAFISTGLKTTIEWLGETVRQTDSSLLDEWEALAHPETLAGDESRERSGQDVHEAVSDHVPAAAVTENTRAFHMMVQNAIFQRVQAAAFQQISRLVELDDGRGLGRKDWEHALAEYFGEYDSIGIGANARSGALLHIDESEGRRWTFRQVFDDPEQERDWAMRGVIDLDASDAEGEPVVYVTSVGTFE